MRLGQLTAAQTCVAGTLDTTSGKLGLLELLGGDGLRSILPQTEICSTIGGGRGWHKASVLGGGGGVIHSIA